MTDAYSQYPVPGDRVIICALEAQRDRATDAGYCVLQGMSVSRLSTSSVRIASGYYSNGRVFKTYSQGDLTGVPACLAGQHRYDLIVFDCSDSTAKRIPGTAMVPEKGVNYFLENLYPILPALTGKKQIVLAAVWVDSTGIVNANSGNYCISGIADQRGGGDFAIDDDTLHIDADGMVSVDSEKVIEEGTPFDPLTGWIAAPGETWIRNADYEHAYEVLVEDADLSNKYKPGMVVKLTQDATVKYFKIYYVQYLNPDTYIYLYGGEIHSLSGTAITAIFYSSMYWPFGMDPALHADGWQPLSAYDLVFISWDADYRIGKFQKEDEDITKKVRKGQRIKFWQATGGIKWGLIQDVEFSSPDTIITIWLGNGVIWSFELEDESSFGVALADSRNSRAPSDDTNWLDAEAWSVVYEGASEYSQASPVSGTYYRLKTDEDILIPQGAWIVDQAILEAYVEGASPLSIKAVIGDDYITTPPGTVIAAGRLAATGLTILIAQLLLKFVGGHFIESTPTGKTYYLFIKTDDASCSEIAYSLMSIRLRSVYY